MRALSTMFVVLVVLGGAAPASASIPDAEGAIHACYNVDNVVSVFDSALPGSGCSPGNSPLSWSQTGPPGPAGPPGPQGPPGTAGQGILGEARQWVDVELRLPAPPATIPDLSFPLPPGNWSVTASMKYHSDSFENASWHRCLLREASVAKQARVPGKSLQFTPRSEGILDDTYVTMTGLFQSSGDGVVLDCVPYHLNPAVLNVISLVAVRVGEIQRFLPSQSGPPPSSAAPPPQSASLGVSLSGNQLGSLRGTYYSPTASAGARRRAETVLLADQGKSAEEIAQATFSTPAQVRSAVRAFRRR